jgi:hypothetical protein
MANRFSDYINPDSLGSRESKQIVQVFDEAHLEKTIILDEYVRSYNPLSVSKTQFLKKYLLDFGGLLLIPGFPRSVYENLILNAAAIYGLKGTKKGLTLFLEILCQGGVLFNTSGLHRIGDFIIPDDFSGDHALLRLCFTNNNTQTDEDLDSYNNTVVSESEESFYFLFDGDSYDSGISNIQIHIISPFAKIREFRDFLKKILPDYLCMAVPESANIAVYLYQHIPTTNYGSTTLIQDILQWP